MLRENELWMGKLQPYMDENFIQYVFKKFGEEISDVTMRTTNSGEPAEYCFVLFRDTYSALLALHRLHDKKGIPGSHPPVKFHLSHASLAGKHAMKNNYSLIVKNLSGEVDDCTLFKSFFERYPSVRRANVVMDEFGMSRKFGFVRFADEEEQKKALIEMEGFKGIGKMFLHVEIVRNIEKSQETNTSIPLTEDMAAVQSTQSDQPQATTSATTTQQDHSQYEKQTWNYYGAINDHYDDPIKSAYDHDSKHRTLQQPHMMPAANQAAAYLMGLPMAQQRKAEHVDQQQNDDNEFFEDDGPVRKKRK